MNGADDPTVVVWAAEGNKDDVSNGTSRFCAETLPRSNYYFYTN